MLSISQLPETDLPQNRNEAESSSTPCEELSEMSSDYTLAAVHNAGC